MSIEIDIDAVFNGQTDGKVDDALADELGRALSLDVNQQTLMMNEPNDMYEKLACGKKFTPFAYQKKAVKDFIYTFKRKGILSDQVGMGKTIEAGMILSELACRQQLKSLLILVPNLTMVYKWESELSQKFGIRNCYESMVLGREKYDQDSFPRIVTVNSKEDVNILLFDAMDLLDIKGIDYFPNTNFNALVQDAFDHVCSDSYIEREFASCKEDLEATPDVAIGGAIFFKRIVKKLVEDICKYLSVHPANWPSGVEMPQYNDFLKWEAQHPIDSESVYTLISTYYAAITERKAEPFYAKVKNKTLLRNSILSQFAFFKIVYGQKVKDDVAVHLGKEKDMTKRRILVSSIAETIRSTFSVMIVGNEKKDGRFWMSDTLFAYEDPVFQYLYGAGENSNYSYFDLLVDMHFSTLIVDEVHNYIDVVSKNPANYEGSKDTCKKNNLFYLFEKNAGSAEKDRYLVSRNCLYAKLLALANHAQQKMFMTATPIKSDMIDFYLLNLLRGSENKDFDFSLDRIEKGKDPLLTYADLSKNASDIRDFAISEVKKAYDHCRLKKPSEERTAYEEKLLMLGMLEEEMFNYITCLDLICYVITEMGKQFFDSKRWEEFKNDHPRLNTPELTIEIEKLIRYWVNNFHSFKDKDWDEIIESYEKAQGAHREGLPESVLRCLREVLSDAKIGEIVFNLINDERASFEQNFRTKTKNGYVPIKTIQSLVSSPDGLKQWRRKYGKLGIRTTRHQTNDLAPIWITLLKPEANEYYGNKQLPVWSRRNGKIINICRSDRFFDYVARVSMNNLVAVLQKGDEIKDKTNRDELVRSDADYIAAAKTKLDEWSVNEAAMNKKIADLENEYSKSHKPKDKNYRDRQEEAHRIYKDPIAQYLYDAVINDGMTGVCEQTTFTHEGSPDFFRARMRLLIKMILSEDVDSSLKLEKGAGEYFKVLVFCKDDRKLFDALLAERNRAGASTKWRNWKLSNVISDLQGERNVLVIVPANKYEEGIDLQEATHLVNFDILHSPLAMEQRIGRIDRVRNNNTIGKNDIYICAFTPLNDWSGFSTSFLAHHLHLFSRWNGDTTGIVSFPVAEKENMSTFDSIVNELESAYKILSDHTEGDEIKRVYDVISPKMEIATSNEPKDTRRNKIAEEYRKAVDSLRFKYVSVQTKGGFFDDCYSPHFEGAGKMENLETHIERQANALSEKLSVIFKDMVPTLFDGATKEEQQEALSRIFYELCGENTSLKFERAEVLSNKKLIANDLRFLYYYHFLLDISSHNLDLYKETDKFNILEQRTTKNFLIRFNDDAAETAATVLLNAINMYFHEDIMPAAKRSAGGEDDPVDVTGKKIAVRDYVKDIKDQLSVYQTDGLFNALDNGDIGSTEGKEIWAGEHSIFNIYGDILNKYFYHLLTIYVYLCRQVKTRLDNMAKIIEDGAKDDLFHMLDTNIASFRKALTTGGVK